MESQLLKIHLPSKEFREYFEGYLDLCDFPKDIRLGLIFFLGVSLNDKATLIYLSRGDNNSYLRLMSLYSRSKCNIDEYPYLDYQKIYNWFYIINLKIINLTGEREPDEDSKLNDIFYEYSIKNNSLQVIDDNQYDFIHYNINSVQNLCDLFFSVVGEHLLFNGYDEIRSYEAGVAYWFQFTVMENEDLSGFTDRIVKFLSPLYRAILDTPVLFLSDREAIELFHLTSHIMKELTGNDDFPIYQLERKVSLYHQEVFYLKDSYVWNSKWDFQSPVDKAFARQVFEEAVGIVNLELFDLRSELRESGFINDTSIIDKDVELNELFNKILIRMKVKYGLDGFSEFTDIELLKKRSRSPTWNHRGDYLQYLTILFYETALHALATRSVT